MNDKTRHWTVVIPTKEERYLSRLPRRERQRLIDALETLQAKDTLFGHVKKLHGRPELSLRVGPFRVLMRPDEESRILVVVGIGSRGDVYK
jgi:mRNA-degrading endonuclease RelE of RelBE toxin-antitoxin system